MKLNFLLLFLLGMCVAAVSAGSTSSSNANLFVNGGFETGDATGWTIVDASDSSSITSFKPYQGSYSAQLGPDQGVPGTLSQTIPTSKGQTYLLSYQLMYAGISTETGFVFYASVNNEMINTSRVTMLPRGRFYPFKSLVTATGKSVTVSFVSNYPSDYYYVDAASFVPWTAADGDVNPPQVYVPYESPAGNLVKNGGFELGLDYWTKTDDFDDLGRITSLQVQSGYRALGSGAGVPMYFSQVLETTPNTIYEVSFWLSNDDGDDGDKFFEVYMNGLQIENNTIANLPVQTWMPFSFLYTTGDTETETVLKIIIANDFGYFFADTFAVVPKGTV